MAENVIITPGVGQTIGADQVVDGTLGTASIQYVKLMDGTIAGTNKATVTAAGAIKTDSSATTQPVSLTSTTITGNVTVVQPTGTNLHTVLDSGTLSTITNPVAVTGTFFQATQPISGTVTATQATGTNLHAVIDSGTTTVTQATGTNLHVVVDTAPTTAVTGTFFQATQPISGSVTISNPVQVAAATLVVSVTGVTGAAVTATLPAVAGQFHYISGIHIQKLFTVANAASATPLVVTTTNLPGSLAWSFGQPTGVIGNSQDTIYEQTAPIHSSVVNTASTIVAPATTGIIWRINVTYFTAA